jgi:O-antigen/teichoic acid export membrane protein
VVAVTSVEAVAPAPQARSLAMYLGSQLLAQATAIARGLLLPNLLGPAGYGLVATVNAVDRYTPYVSVGAHYYLVNRLPVMDADAERERTLGTLYTFTIATSVMAAILLAVTAVSRIDTMPWVVVFGILTLALNPLSGGIWRLHQAVLRAEGRIPRLTGLTNAQSLVSSILLVGLAWSAGVIGAFAAQLVSAVFVLALVMWASPYRFSFRFEWGLLRRALAFSIPVFVVSGLLLTTLDSLEIFAVATHLGVTMVGHYAWAVAVAGLLFIWTNSLTTVFSTPVVRAVHGDGLDGGRAGVGYFIRLLVANCSVFAGLVTVAYLMLPVIGRLLFPGYEDAITAARLVVVSTYYENIAVLGLFVLTAQKRFTPYLMFLAVLVAVTFPLLWWLAPKGIAWVAGLAVARRLVKAHVVLSLALRSRYGAARFALCCGALYVLGLVPVVVGWLVDREMTVTRENIWSVGPDLLGATAIIIAVYGAVLYVAQRRFRLLDVLWRTG